MCYESVTREQHDRHHPSDRRVAQPSMKGFISYSHDDFDVFGRVKSHLVAIERAFDIRFWYDKRINAGYHWNAAILREIEAADVFVLLISPAFIASDYVYEREIPAIQERKRSAGALILPVVLERCYWSMVCGVLQAVPTDRGRLKPIADWRPQANGFDCARRQIADAVRSYFGSTPKIIDWL
jgi:hypothetical protein